MIVGIADKMDARMATLLRAFAALRIFLPQAPLQTIERKIGQHRRDDATLRCTLLGRMEDGPFHVARL
jgi:hypothetical protein